jgi:Fe-S cluster assembly iron-binding protein IscA
LGLALDEPNEKEMVQANGLGVLIAEELRGFATGSQVDYETSIYGDGFTIHTGYGCS